jgi:Ras GTPase-activating-like protein IQGAP2/3
MAKEKKEKKEKKDKKDKKEAKEDKTPQANPSSDSVVDSTSESEATEAPAKTISVSDDESDAEDVDHLLLEADNKKEEEELAKKKQTITLQEAATFTKLKAKRDEEEIDEDANPWFKERECLLLVLQARMLLKEMINLKLKQERIKNGDLSASEIQNLLRAQKEEQETDWITEIQELKRNLVSEVRRNHVLERELNKLDKRIALLIKNRGNIQEVLQHSGSSKKSSKKDSESRTEFVSDPRKLEHYQNLFYLLQTEPKYLASLVYLMNAEQMESFLDTVILTLYGDAFSPREEYLILKLFQLAIQKEMSAIKGVSAFLQADSVVPKMVITYNRRKQGLEFLKTVLSPILKNVITKDINLELKPMMIYQTMISDQEISTGQKSTMDRNLTEDQILDVKEVKEIIRTRVEQLESICQSFFDGIMASLNKVPYGIRWICKQIRTIALESFSNASEDDILKVTGYFIYYRFINLAIVTPDAFEIVDKELPPLARKNLVAVARVLQNLFNFTMFGASDRWFLPLNEFIKKNLPTVRDYFTDLIEVADPEDYLQVDKYMELTQKTKPVIIISLHEIASCHQFLQQNIDKLVKDKEDPLKVILHDLGEAPSVSKEDDREIQLTLTNRFKQNMEEEISASASLYAETKELIISTFRLIPVQGSDQDQTLLGILNSGKKYAKDKGNASLGSQIDKILENIKTLEAEGFISKADNYASFLRDIALEVANRAEIREQQRKEIKRLNQTLRNLRKHQKYLNEQIQQYNDYLQDCRLKHYQPKTKKKKSKGDNPNKIGPFKFSYSALAKKGVIIDSEVPAVSRKKTVFYISSEAVGVFDIVAKIGGLPVEKMTLELDDLLERNYNNITRLELDQVTLDVNMTIHLINKFFLK